MLLVGGRLLASWVHDALVREVFPASSSARVKPSKASAGLKPVPSSQKLSHELISQGLSHTGLNAGSKAFGGEWRPEVLRPESTSRWRSRSLDPVNLSGYRQNDKAEIQEPARTSINETVTHGAGEAKANAPNFGLGDAERTQATAGLEGAGNAR